MYRIYVYLCMQFSLVFSWGVGRPKKNRRAACLLAPGYLENFAFFFRTPVSVVAGSQKGWSPFWDNQVTQLV